MQKNKQKEIKNEQKQKGDVAVISVILQVMDMSASLQNGVQKTEYVQKNESLSHICEIEVRPSASSPVYLRRWLTSSSCGQSLPCAGGDSI